MCGIAGIVALDERAQLDVSRLERMGEVLAHRGPDGAGTMIDGFVALAHRRLAIVDPAGGAQPMANDDGSVWIVFNGEIYNHPTLRPWLEARGHRYRTRSDTETILRLYEEEGARCVERLQGMFAFALWDKRRRELLLARDRLGIKPLYWIERNGELLFASEIKALCAAGVRAELNEAALPELLANRYVAAPETLFRGVRALQPGRTLSWSPERGLSEARYWRPPAGIEPTIAPLEDRASELRTRLETSVREHLMSDVPLGVFLSGGLDSTGIAALAARQISGRLQTFAVGFQEREESELGWARLAARALGTEHHEVVVGAYDLLSALPRLVWHEDEPLAFSSSVPLYFVSKLAREHVKVVLTGEGADELFLGYGRHRITAYNQRLGRLLGHAPRARRALATLALAGPARRWASRTALVLGCDPRSLYCENFAVFSTARQRRLLLDSRLLDARDPYAAVLHHWREGNGDPLQCMSHADISTYLVELLMKQDQMSMAASIESRVPYLDHRLVEHVLALPSRLKLDGLESKAVLRAALRGLVPAAILRRRKRGFPVPLGAWLRGPLLAAARSLLSSRRATSRGLFEPGAVVRLLEEHGHAIHDHTDRLWLLLGLELWLRIFVEGEAPAAIAEEACWTSCG